MIGKIAQKEFLLNLMTFKFAVGTTLCVVLMVVFVPVLARAYQERLKVYHENIAYNERELAKVTVYKNITPTIYRPPSMLAIFSEGLEKQVGCAATIQYDEVPEITGAAANHYLSIFSVFDVSLIFKIVISVLALLVAYDTISGERERGTLKLTLSGTAARHEVLLGKISAGLLVLVVPVTIAFFLELVILHFYPMVELAASDWMCIGLMFLASLVFISTMYHLGLLFSCLARRSAVSLVLGLFLWICFAVVIPNGSVYVAGQICPIPSEDKLNEQLTSLRREAARETGRARQRARNRRISGPSGRSDIVGKGGFGHGYVRSATEAKIHNDTLEYSINVPIKIKFADKVSEIKSDHLQCLFRQTRLSQHIARISPISLYENLMSALAGTDTAGFQQFIDTVRPYRKDVVEYMRSRTDNFSSPSFWTPCTKEEIKTRPNEDDARPLDLRDLPRFIYKSDVGGCLARALPDLVLLLLANVLFFALALVAFLRYDVR